MLSDRFSGKRDFQLYLLNSMRGADQKVDEAIDLIGVTRAQMREVGEEVGERLNLLKLRRNLENVRKIMGDPDSEEVIDPDEGGGSALTYSLPVWPEFYYRILGDPDGMWVDGGFVRSENSSAPPARSLDQIGPWECLRGEVEDRFGPLREGDLWYPYEDYVAVCSDERGALRSYHVQFSWQLLQRVTLSDQSGD